jgi:DNA-binding NarL/FixJ family response regulator
MENKKIKVALYEDNNALRDSLSKLIGAFPDFTLCGAYPNALKIIENTKENSPDVILMDIDMPGMTGIEAVELVHKEFLNVKVLMQTVFDDNDNVFHSICNGAVGYILKKTPPLQMLDAIRDAHTGGAPMSPVIAKKVLGMFRQHAPAQNREEINLSAREKQVLTHLTNGMSYKMIAEACEISIDTVRFHIKKIYEKLHVHSMTEAVAKALRDRLI